MSLTPEEINEIDQKLKNHHKEVAFWQIKPLQFVLDHSYRLHSKTAEEKLDEMREFIRVYMDQLK